MKKILSVLLAASVCASALPDSPAAAAEKKSRSPR